jgi:prolyl-tRNA synthetase
MDCEESIKNQSARKAEEESGEVTDAKAPSMGGKSVSTNILGVLVDIR